jgi:hypothetical protein
LEKRLYKKKYAGEVFDRKDLMTCKIKIASKAIMTFIKCRMTNHSQYISSGVFKEKLLPIHRKYMALLPYSCKQ